ncbi:hypothetical protein [Streptomyces cinnamoneus]
MDDVTQDMFEEMSVPDPAPAFSCCCIASCSAVVVDDEQSE